MQLTISNNEIKVYDPSAKKTYYTKGSHVVNFTYKETVAHVGERIYIYASDTPRKDFYIDYDKLTTYNGSATIPVIDTIIAAIQENTSINVTLETGDLEIGAVEIKDGTTDARQAVKVDNATAGATPTVALVGAHYKASLDTYNDNDAAPLHTDVNGKLLTVSSTADALLTTIDADTSKIPALGNAAMAAAAPVTIASDDTLTAAANASLVTINNAVTALNTAPSMASSVAYEASNVAKAAAGTLFAVWGYNSGAAQYIQVHNTASLPADTAIPIIVFKVPATDNFYFDIGGSFGVTCDTGITVCNSSTVPTKTIGGADCFFNASYK